MTITDLTGANSPQEHPSKPPQKPGPGSGEIEKATSPQAFQSLREKAAKNPFIGGMAQPGRQSTPKASNVMTRIRAAAAAVTARPGIDKRLIPTKENVSASTAEPVIERRKCTTCWGAVPVNDLARVPCSHEHCRGCLRDLFSRCLTDESLFPPQCCRQEIRLGAFASALPPQLVSTFFAKALEYRTLNRTYCANGKCSRFLVPSVDIQDDVATCPECRTRTCASCKRRGHAAPCTQDEDLHGLLAMAKEEGWMACVSCHRLVELTAGCNHISKRCPPYSAEELITDHRIGCPCSAEFCYKCGLEWKTCECRVWDDDMLLSEQRLHPAPARAPR